MMGAVGISVLIASGDDGSAEYQRGSYNNGKLSASMPAAIPYATSVGATTFANPSANSGEQIATTSFGSGGGFSYDYPVPKYQAKAVEHFFATAEKLPTNGSYARTGRGTPDVSALGDGFFVIANGEYQNGGGTSASTPLFSGLVTLLNNVRLRKGKTLGFLNPLFYQNPQVFNDIVGGNNDVQGDGQGWYCQKGWDPATGLGTPNFGKMVELVERLNKREDKQFA